MKLTRSELEILNLMIYPESFDRLLEETGMTAGTLRDDLIHLVSQRYVQVCRKNGDRPASTFYDIDHLDRFAFRATKSGLQAIQAGAMDQSNGRPAAIDPKSNHN